MGASGASRVREGALLVLKEIHRISAKEALLKKNDVESLARAAVARGGGPASPRRFLAAALHARRTVDSRADCSCSVTNLTGTV